LPRHLAASATRSLRQQRDDSAALLLLPHRESDGLELAGEGHRSEHLADITWDAHVRATAGAECRKRIP
jgi:hypothetical protein